MWKTLLRGFALHIHVFHLENTLLLSEINKKLVWDKKMFKIIYGRQECAKSKEAPW